MGYHSSYTVLLACDECRTLATYQHQIERAAFSKARRDGWLVNKKHGTVLCFKCAYQARKQNV